MNKTNINHMLVVINKDATFAKLDVITTGTCRDEGVELFHTNSKGKKVGEYNWVLDFEDLCNIAKELVRERKSYNLSEEECGTYLGFEVKLIHNGGARSHFHVTAGGQVSAEYNGWHCTTEVLD